MKDIGSCKIIINLDLYDVGVAVFAFITTIAIFGMEYRYRKKLIATIVFADSEARSSYYQ